MVDRSVQVKLDLIHAPYMRSVHEAAAETRRFAGQSEADMKRLGASMQSLGTKMTLSVTAGFALLGKQAVGYATDAREALNMAGQVFGRHLGEVEKWADGAVDNFAMTSAEALQAASTFANMTRSMGLAADPARQLGMDLVELAADIGSFRNVDPADMLEKLRAGITGETEPLKALGIVLTEATVKQEAMRLGLASASGEVSEAGKVQARYSLIVKQTAADAGDAARTMDEGAQASRRAGAAYREAMTDLGESLLPLKTQVAVTVGDVAQAFADLPDGAQQAIVAFGGLAAASGPLLIAAGSIIRNLKEIQALGPRAASGLSLAGKGIVGLTGAVGGVLALTYAIDALGLGVKGLQVDVQEAAQATTDELVDAFMALEGSSLFAGKSVDAFRELAEGSVGTAERLRDALAANGVEVSALDAVLAELAAGQARAAADADRNTGAITEEGEAAGTASTKVETLADKLQKLASDSSAVPGAQNDLNLALEQFADNVRAAQIEGDRFATSLDATSVSGLENRATLMALVDQVIGLGVAMAEQGAEASDVAAVMAQQRQVLIEVATQLGFNRDQVAGYVDVLLQVPGSVGTTVFVDTRQAMEAINRLGAAINGLLDTFAGSSIPWIAGLTGDLRRYVPVAATAPAIPPAVRNAVGGGGARAGAARDAAARSGASGAKDAERAAEERLRALEEAEQKRRAVIDNAFDEGLYAFDDYLAELRRRRDSEEYLTDEWKAANDRIKQIFEERAKIMLEAQDRIRESEDIQFEEGRLSNDEYIDLLMERHEGAVRVHGYWSAEARRIRAEIESIEEEALDKQKDQADKAKKLQEEQTEKLVDLLEDEARLRKQLADSVAEQQRKLADVQREYLAEQRAAIDDRRRQLDESMSIEERFVASWGNSASALARNARDQVAVFDEWADSLDAIRGRGLSDAVIDMLGLAEGPQALGQLRTLAGATEAEIAELNAAVEARTRQSAGRVSEEQADSFSTISATLTGLAERHAEEVAKLTEEFVAEQRELTDELNALGSEQGMTYTQAIEQALRSGIPGIVAAAQEVQQAMAGVPSTSGRTSRVVHGRPPASAGFGNAKHGTYVDPDGTIYKFHSGTARVPGPVGSEVDARLLAGERVFSVPDNKALIAAVQQLGGPPVVHNHIYIEGREIAHVVERALDDRSGRRTVVGSR